MSERPVALVTGANQGIGFQIAKDLVGHGFVALVGSRNLGPGRSPPRKSGRTPTRCSSM
jgi:NAD(P)-dependent dehydrogenase (short-subunit alcohol dehydrogenase family)